MFSHADVAAAAERFMPFEGEYSSSFSIVVVVVAVLVDGGRLSPSSSQMSSRVKGVAEVDVGDC